MRIEKISFQQTFPTGQFQNQKLGVEVTLGELEDVGEAFKAAKDLVEKTFTALNPQINWSDSPFDDPSGKPIFSNLGVIIPSETKPRDTVDNIIEDIRSCKDIKVLESYKLIAKTNNRIQEAFDNKMKNLKHEHN